MVCRHLAQALADGCSINWHFPAPSEVLFTLSPKDSPVQRVVNTRTQASLDGSRTLLEDTGASGRCVIVIMWLHPRPWHPYYNLRSLALMANVRQGRKEWSVYSLQVHFVIFFFFLILFIFGCVGSSLLRVDFL